jgi:hypothetical protein
MARGWESKSVESQQEEASRPRTVRRGPSKDELVKADERRTLELTRTRLSGDLARATRPAHREMLEQALAELERKLEPR